MSTQTNMLRTDLEIALFVQREKRRLPEKHHEFIDAAVSLLRKPRLTCAQTEYLYALFAKLGGRIT